MKKMGKCLTGLAAVAILTSLLGATTVAQQPAPRPAPQRQPPAPAPQAPAAQPAPAAQGGAPQRTTATYEDWVLQCEIQAGTPPKKVCEMTQVTQLQGKNQNQPFSRAEVVRPTKDQPARLVIQVPVNVSFAANVRVQIGDADPGLAVPFARCLPNGCFAEFDLKDDTLKKFRSAASPGKLTFADSSGRDIAIPLSFNGFGQAYEALLKE
jgi:invasion protein IalB